MLTEVPLGDICVAAESGFACSKTKLVEVGIPHLRPFNVGTDGRLSLDEVYQVPPDVVPNGKGYLREGDLLFNNTNSTDLVGKTAYVASNMKAGWSNHVTRIRMNKERCVPQFVGIYLHHLWRSGYFKAQCTQWVSQAAINRSMLATVQIPLPPLDEQRRIVDILNHAASIRRLREQAQAKAREIIPALFLDMFGDPLVNERGWKTNALGSLVRFVSGATPSKKEPRFWNGDVPWVSAKDMKPPEIHDAEDHVSEAAFTETNLKKIPVGSVLILVRGMILAHTIPIRKNRIEVAINQDMKAILAGNKLDPVFLRWLLQSVHSYLLQKVSTAGHGTRKLDMEILHNLPIILPPTEEQQRFSKLVSEIEAIQSAIYISAQQVSVTTEALLSQAFENRAR